MIPLKHTTYFLPHKRNAGDTEAHLICRVKWNACRSVVSLNLGYMINPDKWDTDMQMCSLRSFHGKLKIPAQAINSEINRYRAAADKIFERFSLNDQWPTAKDVSSAMKVELGIEAPYIANTEEIYRRFVLEESIERSWSEDTKGKMETTRKHLLSFGPFALMEGFTKHNLALYIEHLRTERGLSDSTIKRHISNVKWFLNWAFRHHYLHSDDFKLFRPKIKTTPPPIVYLTWDELMKLWNYRPKSQDARETLDFFLFCCMTSLRWSDCHNLKWSDVSTKGIRVVAIKTTDILDIDFNKWSEDIINRYIDVAFPGDHVFCRTSNQVMNRQLKQIMKDVGLRTPYTVISFKNGQRIEEVKEKWELITTHVGRKTFICNSLILGIPPTVVMQWTGHEDYDAMKPYIAVADSAKAEEMSKFNIKK